MLVYNKSGIGGTRQAQSNPLRFPEVTLGFVRDTMKNIRIGLIYKHTNKLTGDAYVGKTVVGRQVRWAEHVLAAYAGFPGHFYNAIRKYGPESFRHRTLKHVTEPLLNVAEIHFIAKHDTFNNGYNMTRGGDGWAATPEDHKRQGQTLRQTYAARPELRQRISASLKVFFATPEGRTAAKKAGLKISAALKGKPKAPEHTAKVVAINTGKKRTPAQNLRNSQAQLGSKHSEETNQKISASNIGKHSFQHTPEWNLHNSQARIGRGMALVTKTKLSAAVSAAWARKTPAERSAIAQRRADAQRVAHPERFAERKEKKAPLTSEDWSRIHKARWDATSAEDRAATGAAISAGKKGKPASEKFIAAMRRRRHSAESKERMSLAALRNWELPEYHARMIEVRA